MSKQNENDKLTAEEEVQLKEYVKVYTDKILSTKPGDRKKAEAALTASYKFLIEQGANCSPTPTFTWVDSPLEAVVLAAKYNTGKDEVDSKDIQEMAKYASFGSFEAYWVATYDFIIKVLHKKTDSVLDIVNDIVDNCGVYFTFEDEIIISDKPIAINVENQKLHCTNGPALAYKNGDQLFAVNGEWKSSLMEVAIAGRMEKESK